LVSRTDQRIADLPSGARIGTSSLRRRRRHAASPRGPAPPRVGLGRVGYSRSDRVCAGGRPRRDRD
jgi:hypothetical protein